MAVVPGESAERFAVAGAPVRARLWAGVGAAALAAITLGTTAALGMPAHHYRIVPVAVVLMSAAWLAELTVPRWPWWVLVAAVIGAQAWLTAIGHISSNLLYLLLLTVWVAHTGARRRGLVALALSLAVIAQGMAVGFVDPSLAGVLAGSGWVSWCAAIAGSWFTGRLVGSQERLLRAQERLVERLRRSQEEAERRALELSTLLTVSRSVASTLDQRQLMERLLDELKSVVDYTGTAVLMLEGDALVFAHMRGPESFTWEQASQIRYPLDEFADTWERLARGEPIIIPDVRSHADRNARTFRRLVGEPEVESTYSFIGSCMWVPLVVRDRPLGLLSITSNRPNAFTPHHADLALAFANHSAVAIQNARLFEQAQHAAGLEERQRLARELHDSVSQALYGIALGARTARLQLDRDPVRAKDPVDYVLQLAEAGIAEMRALIFELRPESLEQEGLAAALEKHAASLRARYQLQVEADLCPEPDVPLPVKEALYRIGQEALHNTVKHAQATHVWVRLAMVGAAVELDVRDDGVGFDRGGSFPGHLGLTSMRERIAPLGGTLEIESAPGAGTRITARVPVSTPPSVPAPPAAASAPLTA